MKKPIDRWGWIGVLFLGALLYSLVINRYAVGIHNDDGEYLLAARYLAFSPAFPASLFNTEGLRHLLPGWAMLLAPFARLATPPL